MTFWSGETLASQLPALITQFDPSQIDCAAYTLRIGAEVYISPTRSTEAASRTKKELKEKESFLIPPGQFAFLLTHERVKVPTNAMAFISMKSRIKFKGLVNISGFHVDPGYDGHLVFSVFNAGPSGVHLAQGDDCFLLWYANLDADSAYTKKGKRGFESIPSELINAISGEVVSLAYLNDRLEKVERAHNLLWWLGSVALVLVVGLWVNTCTDNSRRTFGAALPSVSQTVNVPAATNPCGDVTDSGGYRPKSTKNPDSNRARGICK